MYLVVVVLRLFKANIRNFTYYKLKNKELLVIEDKFIIVIYLAVYD